MDLLDICSKVIGWLLSCEENRSKQVSEYIAEIEAACLELIAIEDPRSDKARLLHEQIKVMYEMARDKLPDNFVGIDAWNLFRALSSARIYYWLRFLNTAEPSNFQALLDERYQMSPSIEALRNLLRDVAKTRTDRRAEGGWRRLEFDVTQLDIETVRQICLADIARLKSLRPVFGNV